MAKSLLSLTLLLSALIAGTKAFAPAFGTQRQTACLSTLRMAAAAEQQESGDAYLPDRRSLFSQAKIVATASGIASLGVPFAALAEGGIGTDPEHPIVVIGAGGKCGNYCTKILNEKGLYTKALTRSGKETLSQPSKYVSYGAGDVTKESISEAVKGASGVIFAASASGKKKGGDPAHVDYLGVYNTAKACLENNVPKLVVISAATVTRPDSVGFKATNFFVKYVYGDKVMDYKIAGEEAMRDLYRKSGNKGLAYSVVRPGGLSDKPSTGPGVVHVSQGDVFAAEVTREDVAQVTVAALLKGKATDFTTMEVNNIEGIAKAQPDLPDVPPELIHAGSSSFDSLLDGLLTDEQMRSRESQFMNDFKGAGIESVDKIA